MPLVALEPFVYKLVHGNPQIALVFFVNVQSTHQLVEFQIATRICTRARLCGNRRFLRLDVLMNLFLPFRLPCDGFGLVFRKHHSFPFQWLAFRRSKIVQLVHRICEILRVKYRLIATVICTRFRFDGNRRLLLQNLLLLPFRLPFDDFCMAF